MTWQYVPWVFFWVHPRFNAQEDSNLEKTIKVDQKTSRKTCFFKPKEQKGHNLTDRKLQIMTTLLQTPQEKQNLPVSKSQLGCLDCHPCTGKQRHCSPKLQGWYRRRGRTFIATHSNKFQPLQLSHMGKWGSLLYTNVIPSNQVAYWPIENGILINDSSLTPDCRVQHPQLSRET